MAYKSYKVAAQALATTPKDEMLNAYQSAIDDSFLLATDWFTISEEDIPIGFEFDLYDLGMALASEKGLDVKSCILCNNFTRSNSLARHYEWAFRCVQNKNLPLTKTEKFHSAWGCQFYKRDDDQRKYIIDSFQTIPYNVWINNEKSHNIFIEKEAL